MTWPKEVKPREGESPGTRFEEFEVGAALPELRFTLTPEVCRAYAGAVCAEASGYQVGGRTVAVPSTLAVYLMAVLYRRYPPAQGGIMAGNSFRFHAPLPMDEDVEISATGRIEETFVKRGRNYVRYSARFTVGGELVAEAENLSTFSSANSSEEPS